MLLSNAILYANEDLTGAPCFVPAGSVVDDVTRNVGPPSSLYVPSISADVVRRYCGLPYAYAVSFLYAPLVPK